MDSLRIFCPATVSNLSCGFDILGLALESVGDEMTISRNDTGTIRILQTEGPAVPLQTQKNVAGVAAESLRHRLDCSVGFDISIAKRIMPGSGIGSSAASAAGAVWGINALLGHPLSTEELIEHAMDGEAIASQARHADNVAPALLGGFVLIRSYEPLDIIQIPYPEDLTLALIHPQIEIRTAEARAMLGEQISLKQGIRQWGNVGGLIAGLATRDYGLISRSLEDHVAEPKRKHLIPEYDPLTAAAKEAGALGCGISGSGPSVFALCHTMATAKQVAVAMKEIYNKTGIPFDIHLSHIHGEGVRLVK